LYSFDTVPKAVSGFICIEIKNNSNEFDKFVAELEFELF